MTRNQTFSLRGLACLLLVANHVVGGTPEEGLRLAAGWLRSGVDALAAIRMPLFACIAGLTHFHFKKSRPALLQEKWQRLLLPMLLTGTVFAVTQALFTGKGFTSIDWLTLHWLPVAHYWFLESLFIIFVVWSFLHSLAAKAVFTVLTCGAYVLGWGTPWLGLAGAVYLAPFFALGWWWACAHADAPVRAAVGAETLPHRPLALSLSKWHVRLAAAGANRPAARLPAQALAAVAVLVGAALIVHVGNPATNRMTLAMLAAGALFCLALLTFKPDHALLRWVGHRSYAVFLFHVFFTAPTRQVLRALQVDHPALHVLAGVCAAVLGAALLEKLIKTVGGPALWFMGERPASAPRKQPRQAGPSQWQGQQT